MTDRALKIDLFDQFASRAVGWPVESDDEQYLYGGDVVMAVARKADAGGRTLGENDG